MAAIDETIAALVDERNRLRREGAGAAALTAISAAIRRWQDERFEAVIRGTWQSPK